MGYNISDLDSRLQNYLETNGTELISKTYFNSDSAKLFTVQTGVTGGLEVPIVRLDSTVVLQDGSTCQFNAQGSDNFSARTLKGSPIAVQKEFCAKDLMSSWAHAETRMNAVAQGEKMPFEEMILTNNIDNIARLNERLIWEGDVNSEDENLKRLNGIITIAMADELTVKNQTSDEKIYNRCRAMWLAWDNTIGLKPTIFMSLSNYKKLIDEIVDANMYHVFASQTTGNYTLTLPGTDIEIKAISGITGDTIVMTPVENLYMGIDGTSDAEVVDFWYDKNDRNFKFDVEYSLSVNYGIAEWVMVNYR